MRVPTVQREIRVWTDGACSGNPGPGGWAWIAKIQDAEGEKEITDSGGMPLTTNNRMELSALLDFLEYYKSNIDNKKKFKVTIYSDSAYLVNSINKGWLRSWVNSGIEKPNLDIWKKIYDNWDFQIMTIEKVQGHSTDIMNNRVDALAVKARNSAKMSTQFYANYEQAYFPNLKENKNE